MPRRRPQLLVPALLAGSFAYAATRYVVFGDTPPAQLPLFVANKAVALAAVTLLGLSVAAAARPARRLHGLAGLTLSGLHALLSLPLLHPGYFPRFFAADVTAHPRLTAALEASLLTGAVALVTLLVVARRPAAPERPHLRAPAVALALVALHGALIGWPTFFAPASWPGGLPPVTLLATLVAAASLALAARRRLSRSPRP